MLTVNLICESEKESIPILNVQEIIQKISIFDSQNLYIITEELSSVIPQLLLIIEENKIEENYKITIIKYFESLLTKIPYNISILSKLKSKNSNNLCQIIINQIIFIKKEETKYLNELQELFIILSKVYHNKDIYKYIINYITNFLNLKNTNSCTLIDKDRYYRILELIYKFYEVANIESPYNYFYFNNDGNITINNNKSNILKLDKNLYILLFVKLIDLKYVNPLFKEKDIELNIAELKFNDDKKISVNICNISTIENTDNKINIPYEKFIIDKTNNILLKVISSKNQIEISINGETIKKNEPFCYENLANETINSIILFNSFYGQCSTIMLYKNKNEKNDIPEFLIKKHYKKEDPSSIIDSMFKDGIYKEELLIPLIKNELNSKIDKENILDPKLKDSEDLNSNIEKFINNDLISIYIPTRINYSENSNEIILKNSFHYLDFDAFLNNKKNSGVFLLSKQINNFQYDICGINHFIPLIETMTIYNELLSKQNLEMFINIIIFIFKNYENLIIKEKNSHFFYYLSLFLEKIPENNYEEMSANFKALSLTLSSLDNVSTLNEHAQEFFDHILMNDKILFKFTFKEREIIYELIEKKLLDIQNSVSINMVNIINILLKYDKEKNTKYCCQKHANCFIDSENKKIMIPELNQRIKPVIKIINLIFKKFIFGEQNPDVERENYIARMKLEQLFEILTFDISPCLQYSILYLFFDFFLKCGKKYFQLLNESSKLTKICLFLYKISVFDVKDYLFYCIMRLTNDNNTLKFLEKYIIYYYPTQKNINIEAKNNLNINGVKYNLINLTAEQKELIDFCDKKYLNQLMYNLFEKACDFLEENIYPNTNLHIMISIASKADISLILKFLDKLKKIADSNKIKEIYSNNKLLQFLLDTCYQAYLIKLTDYNKELFEPGFSLNGYLIKDEEKKNIIENIITISNELLLRLFMNNIYKIDYLITWSKYYYQIESDKNKFSTIKKFIFDKFFSKIIEKLFENTPDMHANIKEKNNSSKISLYHTQIIYLLNILFEYYSYYKINGVISGGYIKDIETLYQEICFTFKYSLLSEIRNITNDDDDTTSLVEKWDEYPKIKILFKYINTLFENNKKYLDDKDIFHNYIKGKNNMYISELKILFEKKIDNKKNGYCNKGTELIILIYHYYTFFFTVINNKTEFKELLNEFRSFLLLLIISSTTLIMSKNKEKNNNEWPNQSEYEKIQKIIRVFIFNSLHFIFTRINDNNQAIERFEKDKENSDNKNKMDHFQCINNYLIDTLYYFLRTLNDIYKGVKKIKQTKNRKSFKEMVWPPFKSKNIIENEDIENSASFSYINELYENCCLIEKEENIEGQTIINCEKTFLDEIPNYTLNSINEINFENNQNLIFIKKSYNTHFENNKKIKNYLNSFYEKNRDILFPFVKYIPKRQELVNNIIPIYDNSIYVNFNSRNICLIPNYTIETPEIENDITDSYIINLYKSLVDDIRLYQIKTNFETSQKIRNYRKIKKNLFSFNNIYSNKKYFYDTNTYSLKYKLLNYMTEDYTRIFFTPIIDINYYLPKFSKFNKNILFRKNEKKIEITKITDLSIIKTENLIFNNNENQNKIEQLNGFNLIKKSEYKYIIDLDQKIEDTFDHFNLFKLFINQKHKLKEFQYNNLENSCLIKESYHIRGFFYSNQSEIGFYSYDKMSPKIFADFDTDRQSCFGSLFKPQTNKYENYYMKIPYNDIIFILKRRYYFKICAIEIFTINNKSYLFKFDHKNFNNVFENIRQSLTPNIENIFIDYSKYNRNIGIFNFGSKDNNIHKNIYEKNYLNLRNLYEKWKTWEMPTLKLLMILNIHGNRSYHDINQYPVFPWIILDYTSEKLPLISNLNENTIIRPFGTPMGMMDFNEESKLRKEDYIYHWNISANENEEESKNRYGSHYSNALYVTYYLVRIFPFANIRIELQGSYFDNPNRLFNSMSNSFNCATTQKSDVRELIPELFCLPEIFYNYNNFNMGEIKDSITDKLKLVENVSLPKWCENNGYIFIKKHRELLESMEISTKINNWFNIIFGNKQKGNEAKKINNLFNAETYEDYENKFDNRSLEEKRYLCRAVEFGVTPCQIFKNEAGKKSGLSPKNKRKLFYNTLLNDGNTKEECYLTIEKIEEKTNEKTQDSPFRIFYINKEKKKKNIYLFYNNKIIKYSRNEKNENDQINDNFINPYDNSVDLNYTNKKKVIEYLENIDILNPRYGVNNFESPFVVFNNGRYIVFGGFWNGNILIRNIEKDYGLDSINNIFIYPTSNNSPIVKIIIDKSETFAICANRNGVLFIFKIDSNSKFIWELYKKINDTNCEIVCMAINENLNLLITNSIEGHFMLYTVPEFKLFNSFIIRNDNNTPLLINFFLISKAPLPCIIAYNKQNRWLFFYSINNYLLNKIQLDFDLKEKYVKIYTDHSFNDFLIIYNLKNTCIDLYSMIDFEIITRSPKIEFNFIDFCMDEDMSHILLLVKDTDKDRNTYKVLLLKDKKNEIDWQ